MREKLVIVTSNNSHRVEEPYPFSFFSYFVWGCSSAPIVQLYRNYKKAFSVFRQTFYAARIGAYHEICNYCYHDFYGLLL